VLFFDLFIVKEVSDTFCKNNHETRENQDATFTLTGKSFGMIA